MLADLALSLRELSHVTNSTTSNQHQTKMCTAAKNGDKMNSNRIVVTKLYATKLLAATGTNALRDMWARYPTHRPALAG